VNDKHELISIFPRLEKGLGYIIGTGTRLCFISVGTYDITRPTLVLMFTVSDGWHRPPNSCTILQCPTLWPTLLFDNSIVIDAVLDRLTHIKGFECSTPRGVWIATMALGICGSMDGVATGASLILFLLPPSHAADKKKSSSWHKAVFQLLRFVLVCSPQLWGFVFVCSPQCWGWEPKSCCLVWPWIHYYLKNEHYYMEHM
jgi:hypothetical protein